MLMSPCHAAMLCDSSRPRLVLAEFLSSGRQVAGGEGVGSKLGVFNLQS